MLVLIARLPPHNVRGGWDTHTKDPFTNEKVCFDWYSLEESRMSFLSASYQNLNAFGAITRLVGEPAGDRCYRSIDLSSARG